MGAKFEYFRLLGIQKTMQSTFVAEWIVVLTVDARKQPWNIT